MSETTSARPTPLDRLAKKKATVQTVWIAMDPEVADRHQQAKEQLDIAKIRLEALPDDPKVNHDWAEATDAYQQAKADLEDNAVKFVFRGMGRKAYDKLREAHRPTEENRKKAAEEGGNPQFLRFNPETFPPVLTHASMVEPKMNLSEFMEVIWESEEWNGSEAMILFQAALAANETYRQVDLGKG